MKNNNKLFAAGRNATSCHHYAMCSMSIFDR